MTALHHIPRCLLWLLCCVGSLYVVVGCDDTLPSSEQRVEIAKESQNERQAEPPELAESNPDKGREMTPDEPQGADQSQDAGRETRPPENPVEPTPEPAREPSQEVDQPPRWQLQAMTFNIRYGTANDGSNRWDNRKALLFQVLQKYKPGILGMQEVIKFQLDEITKAVPGYQCIGRSRDADPASGELAPLCVRTDTWSFDSNSQEQGTFWLSQTPETPGSKSWGSSLPRIATWARLIHKTTGMGIYVFNTHFDHVSAQARLESAKLISRRMAGRLQRKEPVLLMGDFNAGEQSDEIRYLRGETIQGATSFLPLFDTFRDRHPNTKDVGTIHGFRGTRTQNKIDYIFAISGWSGQQVDAAAILYDNDNGRYPSDHFPVTAALSFPQP